MINMGLPPQLETDIDTLKKEGYSVKAIRDPPDNPRIYILFEDYPLPDGWKNGEKKTSELLLITDISYPNSKIDMFWMVPGVVLEDGSPPKSAQVMENHLGKQWRRFSWHCGKWNPAVDNVITYLGTVDERLRQNV